MPLRCPRGVAPRPARTNLKHLITTLADLAVLGIAVVSLNEGIDATTPAGRLQMSVLGAIAEFERARIVEPVRAGMARAKRRPTASVSAVSPPHQRRRPGARRPPCRSTRPPPRSASRARSCNEGGLPERVRIHRPLSPPIQWVRRLRRACPLRTVYRR